MKTKLWRMRFRNRGVAMVEAGILAPIFAMMMMMTVYLMGSYETKYRTAMMSRYAAFSYASNSCTDEAFKPVYDMPAGIKNGGSAPSKGGALTQQQDETGGQGTDKYTQGADSEHGAEAGGSMFMANAQSTMTWDYSPTYKFNNGGAKTITSTSQVACNPKKSGMNPFSYISSLAGQIF